MTASRRLNPTELEFLDIRHGTRFECRDASFGRQLGLTRLGISYTVLPPGKTGCPFHNHHAEDEVFIIVSGSGTYRIGEQTIAFAAGDVLSAPAGGRETAHHIVNTGDEPIIYFSISNQSVIDVIEYPESGKMVSRVRDRDGETLLRHMTRPTASLDYWDGEAED